MAAEVSVSKDSLEITWLRTCLYAGELEAAGQRAGTTSA